MKTIFFFLSFTLLVSCSANNEYLIQGTITGEQGAGWVYLQKIWSSELTVDSARIENGNFSFSGTIDVPELYAIFPILSREECVNVSVFILEAANLEIHLDAGNLYNDGTLVKGGSINEEFNRVHLEQQEKFFHKIDTLSSTLKKAGEDERISIEQNIKALNEAETRYTLEYIESHPGSPVSMNLLMWKYFNLPIDEWGRLLSIFSSEMKSTSVYKQMESDYQTQLAFKTKDLSTKSRGNPSFIEVDLTNKSIIESLVELNPGKVLYVDVWGTSCSPCFKEFPYSRDLSSKLDSEKISFIYLCTSAKNEEEWREKISAQHLSGQHLLLNKELSEALNKEVVGMNGIPHYILVGSDGRIAYANAPRPSFEETEKILNDLMP